MVARAAPVIMFVAPGPIDEVQTRVRRRLLILAKPSRGVNHALLVAKKVVGKIRILLQCLSDAGNIAVPKDTQAATEESLLSPVAGDGLGF